VGRAAKLTGHDGEVGAVDQTRRGAWV